MNKPNGYTFLELCVVVSILAIFLLITTPAFPFALDRQKTRIFLDQLSTDLYWAESQARSRQALVYVDIFPNLDFYLIRIDGKPAKRITLPEGYQIKSNFPSERITFYGDGQIAKAGTIDITDRRGGVYLVVLQLSSGRFYIKKGDQK